MCPLTHYIAINLTDLGWSSHNTTVTAGKESVNQPRHPPALQQVRRVFFSACIVHFVGATSNKALKSGDKAIVGAKELQVHNEKSIMFDPQCSLISFMTWLFIMRLVPINREEKIQNRTKIFSGEFEP